MELTQQKDIAIIKSVYDNHYKELNKFSKKEYIYIDNQLRSTSSNINDYNNKKMSQLLSSDDKSINYKKLILNENIIRFMIKRLASLRECITYITNLKSQNNKIALDFLTNQEKILFNLINQKNNNFINTLDNKSIDKQINTFCEANKYDIKYIKEICRTMEFALNDYIDGCQYIKNNILHIKTINTHINLSFMEKQINTILNFAEKQTVLGFKEDRHNYVTCNNLFASGIRLDKNIVNLSCNKSDRFVEWSMLVNKYYILCAYYRKANFMRFILKIGYVMPFRYYSPEQNKPDIKNKVGRIDIGPFNFSIYSDENATLTHDKLKHLKYTVYDDKYYKIQPPLIHVDTTVTWTEFRDLIIYLNLPVFRSTKDKNILFFPTYDNHKELIDIHNKSTGSKVNINDREPVDADVIKYAWFDDNPIAIEACNTFCDKFEEEKGYGIEAVNYEWFNTIYGPRETGSVKKYIFLIINDSDDNRKMYINASIFKVIELDGIKYRYQGKIFLNNEKIDDYQLELLNQTFTYCKYGFQLIRILTKEEEIKQQIIPKKSSQYIHKRFDVLNEHLKKIKQQIIPKKSSQYIHKRFDVLNEDLKKIKQPIIPKKSSQYIHKRFDVLNEDLKKIKQKYIKYKTKYLLLQQKGIDYKTDYLSKREDEKYY